MEVIKNVKQNEEGTKKIEIIKDDKCLTMEVSKHNELAVSFSYVNDENGNWFQESFDVNKEDGSFYNDVDGIFASYSGDVFFDTLGSNLVLFNQEGNYKFFFMQESHMAGKEIKCKFYDDSLENRSMRALFDRIYDPNKEIERPKIGKEERIKLLSKTLQKIVEK